MYLSKQICNVFQSKFHKIFFILFIFHVGKNFFMETTVKENMVNMILQTIPVKVQLKKYNVRTHYLQNQFILLYLLHFVIWWSWGQILPFRSSFILFDGIDGGQCIPECSCSVSTSRNILVGGHWYSTHQSLKRERGWVLLCHNHNTQ